MASINWQKQTMQKAGAMKRHHGQKERLNNNHSNKDIDKSLTSQNYYIGCSDYSDAYKKMRERVAAVDKKYPPERVTKDRKVCCSLEAPCPAEISAKGEDEERRFFEELHKLYVEFFGEENVHGTCVHKDEVHKYTDSKTKEERESLSHGHSLVSCYAEWTQVKKNGESIERKGINGKNFQTKARLSELNAAVCKMVKREFGVEYNTGEEARHKKVEILKAETELAEVQVKLDQTKDELKKVSEEKEAVSAEVERCHSLMIEGVPPRPMPPVEPEKPVKDSSYTPEQQRAATAKHNAEMKQYHKDMRAYKKELIAYPKKLSEWERKYLTPDNLAKVSAAQSAKDEAQAKTAAELDKKTAMIEFDRAKAKELSDKVAQELKKEYAELSMQRADIEQQKKAVSEEIRKGVAEGVSKQLRREKSHREMIKISARTQERYRQIGVSIDENGITAPVKN